MPDRRLANLNWWPGDEKGEAPTWERVAIAILMDIRGELRDIRSLLRCHNTLAIPELLRAIKANTTKKSSRKLKVVKRRAA